MTTIEIISSQIKHMKSNIFEYFYISLPYIIVTFIIYLLDYNYIPDDAPITYFFVLIQILLGYLVAVNIHRLVISNENKNYFSFGNRFKLTLSYLFYTLFIWIIVIVPFLLLLVFGEIMIDTDPSGPFFIMSIVGVILLGLISVVGLFITYPFFALNLPLAAIGEKVVFFRMWKLSKGFRLTIFLQFLIIILFGTFIIYLIERAPFYYFFYIFIRPLVDMFCLTLTISCLSKTFLLWREKIS